MATNAPTAGAGAIPNDTSGTFTPAELVVALEVYAWALANGLTAQAAAGIIGNMQAESNLNPESGGIDSNGYWSGGLVSWNTAPGSYPNARSMVTGNPAKDLQTQLAFLLSNINANPLLKSGLNASKSPGQAASVFATIFERCAACYAGSSEVQGRSNYAQAFEEYVLYSGVQVPKWSGPNLPIPSIPDPFSGVASLAGGLGTIIGDVTSASFWERIGLFALGAVLVVGGTVVFMKATGLEPKALPV